MTQLARKAVAVIVSAALTLGGLPLSALAGSDLPAAAAPAPKVMVSADQARRQFRKEGLSDQVINDYLISDGRLSSLAMRIYGAITPDEGVALQKKLTDMTKANSGKPQEITVDTLKSLDKVLGVKDSLPDLNRVYDKSDSSKNFERDAQIAALTQPNPTPKSLSDYMSDHRADGSVVYSDLKGTAIVRDADGSIKYNRVRQEQQRQWNKMKVPDAPFIPETGRPEWAEVVFPYWQLKSVLDSQIETLRRGKMDMEAELLQRSALLPDMYTAEMEQELDKAAQAASYTDGDGKTTSISNYVSQKQAAQRKKIDEGLVRLDRFKAETDKQKAEFLKNPVQTKEQAKVLKDEKTEIEKQVKGAQLEAWTAQTKTIKDQLDPNKPDFAAREAAIKALGLTSAREKDFEDQMRAQQIHDLEMLRAIDRAKAVVEKSDSSDESQNVVSAAMQGLQQEYQRYITDKKVIYNTLSHSEALRGQMDVNIFNKGAQGIWETVTGEDSYYSRAMETNKKDWAQMGKVINAVADGNFDQARQLVIAMHPQAAADHAPLTADPDAITDDMRADAAFDRISKNITAVQRTNTWVGAAESVVVWSVGMAVGGAVVRGLAMAAGAVANGFSAAGVGMANFGLRIGAGLGKIKSLGVLSPGGWMEWAGKAGIEASRHIGASMGLMETAGTAGKAVRTGWLATAVRAVPANMMRMSTGFATTYVVMGSYGALEYFYKTDLQDHLPKAFRFQPSSFSSWGQAFAMSGEGNLAFFSNGLMPLLMFAGIPYQALRGIPLPATMTRIVSGLSKSMANHGAVGMLESAIKGSLRGALRAGSWIAQKSGLARLAPYAAKFRAWRLGARLASEEDKAAAKIQSKGVHESIYTFLNDHSVLKPVAYVYSQADGLVKFFGLQWAIDHASWQYGYHFGRWSKQKDLGQVLKGANQQSTSNWVLQYWWAFLPHSSAHDMSQNMDAYRAFAGVKALEKEGRLDEYLNAEPDTTLYFEKSWWAKLTDPSSPDSFRVDTAGNEAAWLKELNNKLSTEKGRDAHFMAFYQASLVEEGPGKPKTFRGLKVGPALRAAAVTGMTQALLKNSAEAKRFLDPNAVGTEIGGYRVTPDVQEALANAVLGAPNMIGRFPSGALAQAAETILARNVDSAAELNAPATEVVDAMNKAKSKKPEKLPEGLDAFQGQFLSNLDAFGDSTVDKGMADKALEDAVKKASALGLDDVSLRVLDSFRGYVEGTYKRFNYANNVGKVHERVDRILKGLDNEFDAASHPQAHAVIAEWRAQADKWRDDLGDGAPADLTVGEKNNFSDLTKGLKKTRDERSGLSDAESSALSGALKDIGGSPWVVRDDKGTNMTGWRAEQLKGIVEVLCGVARQSVTAKDGNVVRLYDVIPTGGGKTLVQFIGLLPLIEKLADARGLDHLVYATIPALKAQAMNDFFAFRVVGSRLEFRTPEDIKADIAQAKLDGRNPAKKTMLIGDEADKFLFEDPQTSLGGRAGSITRMKSSYRAMAERQDGLIDRLEAPRRTRTSRLVAAAEQALDLMSESGGHDAEVRAARAELETLSKAKGPQAADLEAAAAAKLAALKVKADPRARDAFAKAEKVLADPLADSGFEKEARKVFKKDLVELKLPGDEAGARLSRDAGAAVVRLKSELKGLGSDPRLAAERDALNAKLAVYETFAAPAADAGRRAAQLREKIAELQSAHDAAVENARTANETEPGAPPELRALGEEAAAIERGMSPAERRSAQEYAKAVTDYYGALKEVAATEREISKAIQKEAPIDDLKNARLAAKDRVEKSRAVMEERERELSAGSKDLSRNEIRARMKRVQDGILQSAKAGDSRTAGLMDAYRDLQKSYSGEENPLYTAMRDMQESMRDLAYKDGAKTAKPGDPVYDENERELNGDRFMLWTPLKLFAKAMWGSEIKDVPGAGLTRLNAARLLRALRQDPGMPVTVKGSLFWDFAGSLLFPRGVLPRSVVKEGKGGDSWVRRELRNQFGGFFEDASAVYINPRSGRVSARFNGQVMEMDIQTLRFWEIQKGADVTLPFRNLAVGGAKDLIENSEANFLFFSATIEGKAKKIFEEAGGLVLGEPAIPSELQKDGNKDGEYMYSLALARNGEEELHAVTAALDLEKAPRDAVAVNKAQLEKHPAMAKEIDAYLAARKIPKDKAFAVNLDDPEAKLMSAETREWLRELAGRKGGVPVSRDQLPDAATGKEIDDYLAARQKPLDENNFVVDLDAPEAAKLSPATRRWLSGLPRQAKGLVSAFCSDSGAINEKYQELLKDGYKPSEIAVIYSDVQYEMANGDAEAIKRKMNLDGMKTGAVKILLIDSDYVIRGIDLNFKGERGDFKSGDFAGYSHVSMLFFGAQRNTFMQLIQGIGRTAKRRVLPNVRRDLQIGANIKVAQNEPAFLDMQRDPKYLDLLKRSGKTDWEELNEAFVKKSLDAATAKDYDGLVKKYFREQWENVSAQKLSASGFSDAAPPSGRFPGVDAFMRGGQ